MSFVPLGVPPSRVALFVALPCPPPPSHQRPPLAAVVDHALHRHHLGQHGSHLGSGRLKDRVDEDKVEVL